MWSFLYGFNKETKGFCIVRKQDPLVVREDEKSVLHYLSLRSLVELRAKKMDNLFYCNLHFSGAHIPYMVYKGCFRCTNNLFNETSKTL